MSRDLHRNLMAPHLLQWESDALARVQGCTVYDMWGAPDTLDESDPMWGVYRFKQGFGGQFVQHMGAWDYSHRAHCTGSTPPLCARLGLMRRRHWQAKQAARSISELAACVRTRAANRSGIHSR